MLLVIIKFNYILGKGKKNYSVLQSKSYIINFNKQKTINYQFHFAKSQLKIVILHSNVNTEIE